MNCVRALEQGAYAVYELAAFHPELLAELPEAVTPEAIGAWLVRCAGRARDTVSNPVPSLRPIADTTG